MCQTTGTIVCAKQQDTLYMPNNRTHCMGQTRGHTLYAKQQNILYVSTNTLMKINRIFKFANTKAQTGLQTTSFQFTPTHLFHSGLICYYTSMYVSVFKWLLSINLPYLSLPTLMTVVQLHNSQRSMPYKCTLATFFIHALFALKCIYIQHYHVVYFSQIRLFKQGLVIKPYAASLGNWTSNCTYGHMLFVGYRVLNGTISTALNGIRLDE